MVHITTRGTYLFDWPEPPCVPEYKLLDGKPFFVNSSILST